MRTTTGPTTITGVTKGRIVAFFTGSVSPSRSPSPTSFIKVFRRTVYQLRSAISRSNQGEV